MIRSLLNALFLHTSDEQETENEQFIQKIYKILNHLRFTKKWFMNFTFYITYIYSFTTLMFHTPLNIKIKPNAGRAKRSKNCISITSKTKEPQNQGRHCGRRDELNKPPRYLNARESTDSSIRSRRGRKKRSISVYYLICILHWRRITHWNYVW